MYSLAVPHIGHESRWRQFYAGTLQWQTHHRRGGHWLHLLLGCLQAEQLLPCAGVSARNGYDMNSLAVPRKAKEAIGGIAALRRPDGSSLTINVEYNLLDPLLRANGYPDGDVNDETGWSPFPGTQCPRMGLGIRE